MKRLFGCLLAACALTGAQAADIGVSIGVSQPGVYGRIDIGTAPAPRLLYPQPVMVRQAPAMAEPAPLYLYVPPGHARNWRKHCGHYQACGQPVYFVREEWVRNVYMPHHRGGHEPRHRRGHHHHGERHDDRRHSRGGHG